MPGPLTHTSPILIVGGGTWGSSTALHLARRGYRNVTVLDPFPYPSPIAAGNDLNKIVDAIPTDPSTPLPPPASIPERLLRAASHGWLHDPVFKPFYHETGFVVAASSPDALAFVHEHELTGDKSAYRRLTTGADFRATMPPGVLTGDFDGWTGWAKEAGSGWAHARKAYEAAANEAEQLGVKFVTGKPHGDVTSLVVEDGDVIGARTADEQTHLAARTILAAGAYSDALLDFKDQLRPTAWTLLHIKMTPEEATLYKNLPVLFNVEKGFFMEPDADGHELKICDEHPGYTNFVTLPNGTKKSVPFARHQVPLASEARARALLRDIMPHLAARPFSFARICWCADTPDRVFLIDVHPEFRSLVLGVGASGHGYSHIPSVGGFIVDAMEGCLDEELRHAFRWRPETAVGRDWGDTQDRWGAERRVMDFGEVKEWTRIGEGEQGGLFGEGEVEEGWMMVGEEDLR